MAGLIAFVDTRVVDWQVLVDELDPSIEVILLDPERDGVQQIAEALAGRSDLDAIHIFSHGSDGALYLGSTVLSSENLDGYATALSAIGDSLRDSGDILLYGCNVAASEQGENFIQQLAQYTGADVAASDDLTGAASLGGDWVLEAQAGAIETQSLSPSSFEALLISEVNLSDIAAGTGGFVINGQCASDWSGVSVAGAGDVNGDGLGDLIVGAPRSDPAAGAYAGRSYVVFGKTGTAAVDLSAVAAGSGGFVISGQCAYDQSGGSVASAGDVKWDPLESTCRHASLSIL